MKKFIALAALVLVSMASTAVYAQESRAERRADRKAERDTERASLRAEEQAANTISYDDALAALKDRQFVLDGFRHFQHQLRIGEPTTRYGTGGFQHRLSRP